MSTPTKTRMSIPACARKTALRLRLLVSALAFLSMPAIPAPVIFPTTMTWGGCWLLTDFSIGDCWTGFTVPSSIDTAVLDMSYSADLEGLDPINIYVKQPGAVKSFLIGTPLSQFDNALKIDVVGAGTFAVLSDMTIARTGSVWLKYGTNAIGGTLTIGTPLGTGTSYRTNRANYTIGTDVLDLPPEQLHLQSNIVNVSTRGYFTQNAGSHSFNLLTIDGDPAGDAFGRSFYPPSYNLNVGVLNGPKIIVGNVSAGSFWHYGGQNNVTNSLIIGNQPGSNGSYIFTAVYLSDSVLNANIEYIGYGGIGAFAQSAVDRVKNSAALVSIGHLANSDGTYTLNGGTLTAGKLVVGAAGTGTFNQNGGTVAVASNLTIGESVGSTGTYTLSDGSLVGGSMVIGDAGIGSFNQNGGMVRVSTISLGNAQGGDGYYSLSGGTLTVAQNIEGGLGKNTFDFNGGTLSVAGLIQVSNFNVGSAAVYVNDIGKQMIIRKAMVNNGDFTNAGTVTIGGGLDNGGRLTLAGGQLNGTGLLVNNGQMSGYGVIGGSALTNYGSIAFTGGNSTVIGKLTNNAGASLSVTTTTRFAGDVVNQGSGRIIVDGGSTATFLGNVDVSSGAEINITAGSVGVFYGTLHQRTGSQFTGTGTSRIEGILQVGGSPGYGANSGDVIFGPGSAYLEDIGGVAPCGPITCVEGAPGQSASYTRYLVGGKLAFGGTLMLASSNGFTAQAGQSFDLFDWGTSSGTFQNIDARAFRLATNTRLDTSRLYTDGTVRVAAVPEAETYAMMLACLGLLGVVVRRRKIA